MPYFGRNIRTAVFGQSHAAAIGVTIDGLPAGEAVDAVELEAFMARRAPEQNRMTTQRREADRPEILCGIVDGRTCGAPLTSIIRNGDTRSKDYAAIADLPRPSHADWPAHVRYGGWQDVRGGGAFSARLTAPLCIAGGIAMQILARRGIRIAAHVRSVGAAEDRPYDPMGESSETIEESLARSPVALSNEAAAAMAAEIEAARQEADSIGGTVECMISGLPVGLGGPLFEGLDGRIAQAVFAVPAVKSVEFGEGFGAALLRGSENNDPYGMREGAVTPLTNRAGGIASGMTTGMPVVFRVALKPTPSIGQSQHTVSLSGRPQDHGPSRPVRGRQSRATAIVALDVLLDAPARLPDAPVRPPDEGGARHEAAIWPDRRQSRPQSLPRDSRKTRWISLRPDRAHGGRGRPVPDVRGLSRPQRNDPVQEDGHEALHGTDAASGGNRLRQYDREAPRRRTSRRQHRLCGLCLDGQARWALAQGPKCPGARFGRRLPHKLRGAARSRRGLGHDNLALGARQLRES